MKGFYSFVAASVLLGLLYLSSLYNYLLFHSLAEIFSIVIACGIFITAWNSRRFLNNDYLLFIGISYLFIASLDLIHTFAYSGMNIFRGYGNNLPTQLWIAARYMEGLSLFIAPLILRRKISPGLIFLIYTAATFVLIASIFEWNIFPDCFVEGTGLTPFKKGSEFVISLILLSAIGLLLRNREHFDRTVLQWLVLSIGLTIASELAFTFYVHVYGLSNLIGHYFKILSFYFIYKAIIETGLSKPYDLLFRQLKQSEESYRSLFTHMINGFAYHKALFNSSGKPVDYVFLQVNDAFEWLTGLKREYLIGKTATEAIPGIEKDPADWIGTYGRVAAGGGPVRFERFSEPLKRWYSVLAYSPAQDHFVTVFEEITEKRRAEEALRESEERYRTVANFTRDWEYWRDPQGRFRYVSPSVLHHTGYGADEFIADPGLETRIIHPEDLEGYRKHRLRAETEGAPGSMDFRIITREGEIRWMGHRCQPVLGHGDRLLGNRGSNRDITDQKRAEEALREEESRFRLLSETAGLLLASGDPQGIVNELCRRVMEYLECHVFFNFLVDEKANRLRLNACAGIPEEEARNLEWLDFGAAVCGCIARDGVRIVADDTCPMPCPRTELVKSFGIQAYACHPLNAQGKIIGTLSFGTKTRTRFSPQDLELMKTVTDQVAVAMQRVGLIGELRNSRDELEVRVRERTAELNSMNKELQDFVFLTSHDLQEPLRKIQVFGDLLSEKFRGAIGEKGLDYLTRMRAAAARMQDLLKSLLSYSRLTTGENMIERVELAKAVEKALLNLDVHIKETHAKIEIDELPVIEVDYSQAVLLFQNLIANALKFHKELEPPRVKIHAALVENGSSGECEYEIRVEDNGIGFDEKYLDKVFTPFQRLHRRDEYEGLGIGVPICKKIAERHGGTLTARSTPGKGSTFIVTFPVNQKPVLH